MGMQKKKKNGEPQRYRWERRRRRMANPKDIGGNTKEEKEEHTSFTSFPTMEGESIRVARPSVLLVFT